MEDLSRKLAKNIGRQLELDEERVNVLAYGLLAILQMLLIFGIVTVITLFLDCWFESLIIFLGVGFLRRSTGGAHSETFVGCVIFSILLVVLMSFFARYAFLPVAFAGAVQSRILLACLFTALYAVMFRLIYRLVPVGSVKRPIQNPKKIARLRRSSFITLGIYYISTITLTLLSGYQQRFLYMGFSFCLASLWQTFTLTQTGHRFTQHLDAKFGITGKSA